MKACSNRRLSVLGLAMGLLVVSGCGDRGTPPAKTETTLPAGAKKDGDHGHSHERGKMLLADAGPYHALLTAHLSSKDGNEWDIFLETAEKENPTPVAIPVATFTAQATTGQGEPKELKFEPAPMEERKGDKPGTCSHFVAKAPWMKPGDNLYVVAKVTIDGEVLTIRWKDFSPKKYAHHED